MVGIGIMVTWPAVIKYEGDNELFFVSNQSRWDAYSHELCFEIGDILIDSEGLIFHFKINDNEVLLSSTDRYASLDAVLDMLKAHLAEIGHCCASKFSINTVAQGILAVAD